MKGQCRSRNICTVSGSTCANGTRICHNVTNVMECLDPLDLRLVAHTCPVELAACNASDWGLGNTTALSAHPSTRTTACGQLHVHGCTNCCFKLHDSESEQI